MNAAWRWRAAAALLCAGLAAGAHVHAGAPAPPGVFVIGVDGMDPEILERLIGEGAMPNFAKLAREGGFVPLGTANPPQSPVAWSSFVTGADPGVHGIFDFIHRDPATYHPISSATPPLEPPSLVLRAFGLVIPLGGSEPVNNRRGTPWWDVLTEHGVDVEVFQIPGNFPTPPSEAKVLDGMGTVDLRGGFGTYTLYTDAPVEKANPKGDVQFVSVADLDLDGTPDTARGVLRGPPDQMRLEPNAALRERDHVALGVAIHVDPEAPVALIEVGGEQVVVKEGEWSDWVEVSFALSPAGAMSVAGAVRFYAKELRPHLRVYASPVNLSAADPAMPITSPDDFIDDLYRELGHFYTQGLPEDTDALKDGVFTDDDYIRQVEIVQEESRRLVDLALERFEPGDATFVYFSDIDLQSHMLWRHGDPKYPDAPPHPAWEAEAAARHSDAIERFYRDVDAALGAIRARLPAETLLVVMSDHGFQPYRRKMHLNAWLRNEGYLVMKPGKLTGQIVTGDVDWSRTRAYGLGFNGLYLNRKGREAQGIVTEDEAEALIAELTQGLEALRDVGGETVVRRVYRGDEVYSEPRRGEGPDLVVGYDRGYGCSDASTLGEITRTVLEDNTSRWSGSHLMAPDVVPGVLLTNRPIRADAPDLTDLTATLLAHYGIAPLPEMTGKPLL